MKIFITIIFSVFITIIGFSQTNQAADDQSDYFIDVEWTLPETPCTLDGNNEPYDLVTTRLLRDGQEVFFQTYEAESIISPNPEIEFTTESVRLIPFYLSASPVIQNLQNHTFEFWFKSGASSDNQSILTYSNFQVDIENNSTVAIVGSGENYSLPISIPEYTWIHIAIAKDIAGTSEFYINGQSIGSIPQYLDIASLTSMGEPIGSTELFNCGEIRIWDKIITASEIAANFTFPEPTSYTNLVSRFKADPVLNRHIDVATSYDGEEQIIIPVDGTNTLSGTVIPFVPNLPVTSIGSINGTFRDYVGPNQSYSYDMTVFVGPFGNIDAECVGITDIGSTAGIQGPTDISVSNDRLDEIYISWKNKSDLATSFKLFRDGALIATITEGIAKDSVISFTDKYIHNGSSSIQSGQDHVYTLELNSSFINQNVVYPVGVGSTLDIAFTTSTNEINRVLIGWQDVASPLIDKYRLYRKNKQYALKAKGQISHIDAFPHYGDSINYQLQLIKDDIIVAAFADNGYVAPNGSISGRVLTEEGQFPVKNVKILATRQSTGDTISTYSNVTGDFLFSGLSYGLLDSFTLEASLDDHSFTYFPMQNVGLNANIPTFENAIILDDFTFSEGSTQHILTADAIGVVNEDKAFISWEYSTDSPQIFLDVRRNGDIIYSEFVTPNSGSNTGSFVDLEGLPKEETKYQVRIYEIVANAISAVTKEKSIIFPDVSKIPIGNFTAIKDSMSGFATGNMQLQWAHTSQNIDGFRVYRNETLVNEFSNATIGFIDTEAPFDSTLQYSITAIRKIGNTTYETKLPTDASPSVINLGPMPTPPIVYASIYANNYHTGVSWDYPADNEVFNYTGYCVYRNDTLIHKLGKVFAIDDFHSAGMDSIVYEVSRYRTIENGIIESARTPSDAISHPTLVKARDLNATPVPEEGVVNLTWVDGFFPLPVPPQTSNGFQLFYNGSLLVKLPFYITEYKHMPNSGSIHNYELFKYRTENGIEVLSELPSSSNVTMNPQTGVVYPPQNLMASRDLPNHVKLCWEYLDFVASSFEILRDNELIATLPVGSRSYYDYTADPDNHQLAYRVRAVQNGQVSKYVGAVGDIIGPKLVFGTITHAVTKLGVPNVSVFAKIDGLNRLVGKTDSSGYYSIALTNEVFNKTIEIEANYAGGGGGGFPDETFLVTNEKHYEVNLELNLPETFVFTKQATIEYAQVDIDVFDLSGNISWQPTNKNYHGVEISRGLNVIADVIKEEGNLFIDTTAVPGINYVYQFRTYLNNELGRKYSKYYQKVVTFAPLSPVINLTATALIEQNAVQVQWSHLYDHADGYAISRNGVFLKEVLAGSPFTFIDSTGTRAEQYTYTLVAYKVLEGQIYFSGEESVTVTYPGPAKVKNLTLDIPYLTNVSQGGNNNIFPTYFLNHVDLSWEYNGYNSNGFKVFRNGELIATVPADSLSYQDYFGQPEANTTYAVSAVVDQNGVSSESAKVERDTIFPVLQPVYTAHANSRLDIGDAKLTWKYKTPGVDYFQILIVDHLIGTILDTVIVPVENEIEEETTFEYIDRNITVRQFYRITAHATRNGEAYVSEVNETNYADYIPAPVTDCNATLGIYDNAVDVTWQAAAEANLDSFTIKKYQLPENTLVSEITLDKGKRSYMDLFDEGDLIDSFTYEVLPGRIIDGAYIIDSGANICSSLGYPGCVNEVGVQNFYPGITGTYGTIVSIDKEWMAVGDSDNDIVYLYKFEEEEWILKQTIENSAGSEFGAAVALDDKILVVGAPNVTNTQGIVGGVVLYRYDDTEIIEPWKQDQVIIGNLSQGKFGQEIAVDNGKVVISQGQLLLSGSSNEEYHQKSIRVFVRPGSCTYDQACTYNEIIVTQPDAPVPPDPMDTYNPDATIFVADTPPSSIDIDGNDIIIGRKMAQVVIGGYHLNMYGYVTYAKIGSNAVTYQDMFLDPETNNLEDNNEEFGADVAIENGIIAVSSPKAIVNTLPAGKVSLFDKNATDELLQTALISDAPLSSAFYGNAISMEGGFLGVSEPLYASDNALTAKLFLYKINTTGDEYVLVQSPDPTNPKYRPEFYDSGSPDKYPTGFGYALDISENHVAVGRAYFSSNGGETFILDLFKVSIENLSATDGTSNDTKISWSLGGCDDCPANYIDAYNIYRNAELIGNVSATTTQFFDEVGSLITGASEAIAGKAYIYEVEAVIAADFEYKSKKAADVGFSKRKGKLSGDVFVSGTTSPVPGVTIVAVGIDETEQTTYTYTTTSLSDGSFVFNNLYIGTGITYTLTPSYLDHDLEIIGGDTYLLTPDAEEEDFIIIFDNTAFVVTGQVVSQNTQCGIGGVLVEYYHTVSGIESLRDTSTTNAEGFYSMIIDPNIDNLNEIRINVENLQEFIGVSSDTSFIQYDFMPSEKVYTSFENFSLVTVANFEDQLTYPVTVSVENTCGNPLANQPVLIRVSSDDGCFEYNEQTDNFGEVVINLTPKEYTISVEGIVGSGVDNYENAGIDFLNLRPVRLDLLSLHIAAGQNTPLPAIGTVRFVYHRAVNFAYTTSFDRFLCNDTQNPAILTQGDKHQMDFILSENHRPGESCEVSEGYIIVRNSGAIKVLDTLHLVGGEFETYSFTAGLPNLVAPHTLAITLQYFSVQGSLLGSKTIPIIVEGQRLLPGTGIITDALNDESGDLQLPLLVLRDPPGDGSYSTIESGSTISKSIDFTNESSGSAGFYLESQFSVFGGGVFANLMTGAGIGNGNGSTIDYSVSTTQAYSTSKTDDAVGRDANVIVGAGISTQYGLTQVLSFEDNCTAKNFQILGFGLGGFNSTYAYTVAFIEGLIDGYRRDSLLVELDLKPVTRPDGSFFSKDESRSRFTSLIKTWEEMLHYHDVETVPHYVLCQDFSYRDDLSEGAQAVYDGWRNGFCNQIGSYDSNDKFTMNDEIIWTPALISAYNNTIAFTNEIKGLEPDFVDDGGLDVSSYDISANNLSITNQFHNTLGNAAKSAEVFDISGNVIFEQSITAQQSSSTNTSFSRFIYLDAAAGGAIFNGQSAGFGLITEITNIDAKIGVSFTANASISVNKSQAETNESEISYYIFDDDAEDQVTFLALQAPLQDQTPYFIRLGGLSSCPPEEALTLNQDNSPLLIDDPTITVVIDPVSGAASPCPPPVYDVAPDEAAIFEVQMGNLGPTGLTRDAKVFLDLESNPFGAIVKIGGSNLNIVSPIFSIPAGGSITQFLTVERPNGTPFYVFEGLRIGIEPECGGEAKYIKIDVTFESPCSPISITKPFEGLIVNRINPFIPNDREVIPYELRDFQANNELLEHVQLQFKRLGTGTDWQNVPGGRIERLTLKAEVDQLPVGQDPLYLFEWDITGQYNLYPDGQYKVRAFAFCGTSGRQYSNETEITLARSALLITGYPEPADGTWIADDEISTTYTTDIDCGIYSVLDAADISQYLTLIDLETMLPVPFTHDCQNNKLTIIPTGNMDLYDGHTLRATYKNITNIIGNKAQDVIWDFRVITQLVDWEEPIVEVTLYTNEIKTVSTSLFNTTSSTVNGLSLSGTESWYNFDPNPFSINGDASYPVELTFDGAIGTGTYMTTLQVNGLPGRTPSIVVKLNVLTPVPTPSINGTYTDSMELIANWSFLEPLLPSTDKNDVIQVYKDGQIRGFANLEEQGNYFFTRIKIFGNASDQDGQLDFVIWNADEAQAYIPIASTNITFKANTTRGVLTNPEILLVEDDLYEFGGKIYVDSLNINGIHDGLSWATAFADLQDALDVANDTDTIWMAGGTYYPSLANRTESFEINEAVAILGGFQSGMTAASQRTGNNETILSGNIGIKGTATDNSYHVVKTSGIGVLLDMLSFSDGNADGSLEDGKGGCLYNTGEVSLVNCSMSNGQAMQSGSLIYTNGTLVIDGGKFYIPSVSSVSNLHNDGNGLITIKKTVEILQD